MICYLVCATEAGGIREGNGRGWTRIAAARFVTPQRDDVRVIWRAGDLAPLLGAHTPMVKAADYETGPENEFERRRWFGDETTVGEKARFDRFVAEGNGMWIDV